MDWKKKIDAYLEEKRLKEQAERDLWQASFWEDADKDLQTQLRLLGQSFKCFVCGRPATKPVWGQDYPCSADGNESTSTDWSTPGDLFKCKICENWICADHIHMEICQKCAEGL
jgi:hypothetical protein